MKLGLVTYNLARDWDIETIIARCETTGFEAVEFRTTHAHGVEVSLSPDQRPQVRRRFEESSISQLSLGSTCEYHAVDPGELRRQIDLTKSFVELAADIGAVGVKVRPNGLQEEAGIPVEKTLEQIGLALRECGQFADNYPVSIWLEVHGRGTSDPPNMKRIMEVADHTKVGVCWNSNDTDVIDGSVRESFRLLQPWVMSVHINEMWKSSYPWRELFGLLQESGYKDFCLAEIPASPEPERLMRYYVALWRELCRPASA